MEKQELQQDKNVALINKEFEALKERATQIGNVCQNIKITDETSLAFAEQKSVQAKEIENVINALHKKLKQAPWDLCKQIDSAKNNLMLPITQGLEAFKEQKKNYIIAEQQKKAKELAEAQATINALNKENANTTNQEIVTELQVAVTELQPTKAKGTRDVWRFEVVDFNQVPKEWLCVDESKVKAYLENNKVEQVVNGVKFYKDIIIVAG
jgi:hypothetical protein